MARILINWVLSALAVWVVAQLPLGIHVRGLGAALVAAIVIGFINATLGAILKVITFPLTILTLGIFWLVINALIILFRVLGGYLPEFGEYVLPLAGRHV